MSVMSRTTVVLLPRSVTSARHGLDCEHGVCCVGLEEVVGVGLSVRDVEVRVPVVGGPQAAASRAVTASNRNQPADLVFIQCKTQRRAICYEWLAVARQRVAVGDAIATA